VLLLLLLLLYFVLYCTDNCKHYWTDVYFSSMCTNDNLLVIMHFVEENTNCQIVIYRTITRNKNAFCRMVEMWVRMNVANLS